MKPVSRSAATRPVKKRAGGKVSQSWKAYLLDRMQRLNAYQRKEGRPGLHIVSPSDYLASRFSRAALLVTEPASACNPC